MSLEINVLFISDIVGTAGLKVIDTILPSILKKYKPDFVIANGENSHEGKGLNEEIVKSLFNSGIHVLTGGNHSFDKWKILSFMKQENRLLRPLNYPKGVHGYGFGVYDIPDKNARIGVLNLQGRTFLPPIDDPFKVADWAIDKILEETKIIFVDMHAEASAEKIAMGWYLNGRVSVVVGTHTHTPTADARVLDQGTGYITDVGMTGSFKSVIGLNIDAALRRFLLQTPQKYIEADGDNRLCGVITCINSETGKCNSIKPVIFPEF